ncbi:hypothetical protein [Sinorhizobium mexicanum]|uniref:Uncharacterized protein n=1 Tax=Sinorhizobium mexicanum TaxID=375549 RepID=A0A859R124_9HYPH|nr:hypothetical protein [Sinorhizobium mexicanum]MBP1886047.1 hypothetical protein [Sinorhizobium mexicanum]QLL65329.1 hypothetical protein FKV68_28690 [Sinorhizobium mexicanum]
MSKFVILALTAVAISVGSVACVSENPDTASIAPNAENRNGTVNPRASGAPPRNGSYYKGIFRE